MSSTDSFSDFFALPRREVGEQQSTESMSSTQMRFLRMNQGMGMGSGASAEATPEMEPGTMPRTMPGITPGTTPGTMPRTMPGITPGMTSGTMPGAMPGTTPGTMPRTMPGITPGMTSGTMPGAMPGTTPGTTTGTIQGTMPRTTRQQTGIPPSTPGMDSIRQQVTPPVSEIDIEQERQAERTPLPSVPESAPSELLQLSSQEVLAKNIGEFVIVEFLLGTNMIEKRQGIIYNVGESYIVLFDEQTKTFVLCDADSIKFVTFYLPGQRPPQSSTGGLNIRGR